MSLKMPTSILALLAVAAPVAATAQQGIYRLEECALGGLGTEVCSPEQASAALEFIEPAWGLQFDKNDPFAIVTVLGYLKEGIDSRIATGNCQPGEELAYAAVDIQTWYIGDLPEGAPTSYEMEFAILTGFIGSAVAYLENGNCTGS